jgi:hypothetical protein
VWQLPASREDVLPSIGQKCVVLEAEALKLAAGCERCIFCCRRAISHLHKVRKTVLQGGSTAA